MNARSLFHRTRIELTLWYCLITGLLLGATGLGIYQLVRDVQTKATEQKLQALADSIHDSMEPILQRPGILPVAQASLLLPGICLGEAACPVEQAISTDRHVLGIFQREQYYVRFIDRSGTIIARVNHPPNQRDLNSTQSLILISTPKGQYLQASSQLRTTNHLVWGYVQVGKSLTEQDQFLNDLQQKLILGMSSVMVIVGWVGWWLAGRSMKPVYQSYQQIQQFTADATHELQTPLTILKMAIEDSYAEIDVGILRSNLDMIARQELRLTGLVKDLLLISRIEQKQLTANPVDYCLDDVIDGLVAEFRTIADGNHLSWRPTQYFRTSIQMHGDVKQIHRMISNLLQNAIRYTPEGGEVGIKVTQNNSASRWLQIIVWDTGIGISKEDQAHIFDRFYRAQSDRARHTGGTGLGLAIAQAIVNIHGGRIEVQSNLDLGSTFIIHLPYKPL